MCGIAGIFDPTLRASHDDLRETICAMTAKVSARGPDGRGHWVDPEVGLAFGHTRLSILDLSPAGAQPMLSADGHWLLTFNGEIYNHPELRQRLESHGVRFRGHSDTEVLVEGIATWGLSATLDLAEGMFAFGLWDRRLRRLTLVRDRFGEKPLAYGMAGDAIVFGSTLDVLAAHPRFDTGIDQDALATMLRFKCIPAPQSIYRNARKLCPGHLVEITQRGIGVARPYWNLAAEVQHGRNEPFVGSISAAADKLGDLLRQSVAARLTADVPVGAFLSGGIDSSLVVSAMCEAAPGAVRTFTIGSPDAGFDESADARAVAAHLGTQHHEFVVTGDDALAAVNLVPRIYDEPFGDSSQIPTFLVAQLARPQVTVALTGDAGDELFGGYNRYRFLPAIHRRMSSVPAGVRRVGVRAFDALGEQRVDRWGRLLPARLRQRQLGLKVSKVAAVADVDSQREMYWRVVSHWADPTTVVPGVSDVAVPGVDSAWQHDLDPVEQMMLADSLWYLPADILTKVDRATMAVGLEARVPFLDRTLLRFAASLPADFRWQGSGKMVSRELLYRRVPRELLERPKTGFGVPLDGWLRGPLRSWGEELLSDPSAGQHLNCGVIRSAWHEHQRGLHNHGHRLWDVLMFLAWADDRGLSGGPASADSTVNGELAAPAR
jgi:asparagine synthase (glutamine-hydrolysing)